MPGGAELPQIDPVERDLHLVTVGTDSGEAQGDVSFTRLGQRGEDDLRVLLRVALTGFRWRRSVVDFEHGVVGKDAAPDLAETGRDPHGVSTPLRMNAAGRHGKTLIPDIELRVQ